jgi:hypothetical protein
MQFTATLNRESYPHSSRPCRVLARAASGNVLTDLSWLPVSCCWATWPFPALHQEPSHPNQVCSGPLSPDPTSPHHLRRKERATAGSAEKMEMGMARSLVGEFSGLKGGEAGKQQPCQWSE